MYCFFRFVSFIPLGVLAQRMRLSCIGKTLLAFGLTLFFAPSACYAVSLSNLFQGSQIAAGGKIFTDWTLISLETTGGSFANFEEINVTPILDNPAHTGLRYSAQETALGTPSSHPESTAVRLIYSFNVQATGDSPPIQDAAALIDGFRFFARESARIRIIETIQTESGNELAELVPFVRPGADPDVSNFQVATFLPQSALHIITRIDIEGPVTNDSAQLRAFEQRFAPVPEPAGVALVAGIMVCCRGARFRRLRR
jgi:hypothetical protein